MQRYGFIFLLFLFSCKSSRPLIKIDRHSDQTGSNFYQQAAGMAWKQRDSLAIVQILAGNIPSFLKRFEPVEVAIMDSISKKIIRACFFVTPDYLSIGTDEDWARIPLTAMAAQKVADSLFCFLPTRKMVNDIYRAATVKLEPVPMYAFRDSTPTFWQHHLIIEGQRKGQKGLIAGIKKDLVISGKLNRDTRPNREAIYGWHKKDGNPIQPLYTGHINWWVDYSHGIRLIYQKILVGNKWMDYREVLQDPQLRGLLCDEEWCDFYRYEY